MSTEKVHFTSTDDMLERLLALDFNRDLVQDPHGSLQAIQKRIKWHLPLKPLPSYISDVEEYHTSFFSLFMIECLEILSQAKYNDLTPPCHIEVISCNITGVFGLLLTCVDQLVAEYSPGDLALLYISDSANESVGTKRTIDEANGSSPPSPTRVLPSHPAHKDSLNTALGYVTSVMKNRITVKILLLPPKFATMETFNDRDIERLYSIQKRLKHINNRNISKSRDEIVGEWYMTRLLSLTTIIREFKSLCMLDDMPLKDSLFKRIAPEPSAATSSEVPSDLGIWDQSPSQQHSPSPLIGIKIPDPLRKTIESKYNTGQLTAISNSLSCNGITLIQGPPGTGKTTTIMGIISVILYSESCDHKFKCSNGPGSLGSMDLDGASDFRVKNPWFFDDALEDDLKINFDDFDLELRETSSKMYNIYDSFNHSKRKCTDGIYISTEKQSNRRILICAPSNAAIDEIVKRLVSMDGGIFDGNGNRYNPVVTRVGPNLHEDLKEYSLESKVQKWFDKNNMPLDDGRGTGFKKQAAIMDILLNSEIVCSTLSGCGSKELYGLLNCFDTLIVDEATQAVELSTLIPMNLGCKRAILVGDPCQLSATVCSRIAIELNYDRSLFKRLQLCGYPVNFLKLQYRMDPQITRFPSMYFYQNQLINANTRSTMDSDWRIFPLLRPTVFYALDSHESRSETSYINEMEAELVCQLLEIIIEVLSSIPNITIEEITQKIAVISPYAAQTDVLKNKIAHTLKVMNNVINNYNINLINKPPQIYVSTVDGFQGMEKEIIIFSAVRTNYVGNRRALHANIEDLTSKSILTIDSEPHDNKKISEFNKLTEKYLSDINEKLPNLNDNISDTSFIADRRRINVAITRARSNLFIVGNPRYLLDHKHWSALYAHYAKTGSIFICRNVDTDLNDKFLKQWSINYLRKSPESYEKYLNNKYLSKFVKNLKAY